MHILINSPLATIGSYKNINYILAEALATQLAYQCHTVHFTAQEDAYITARKSPMQVEWDMPWKTYDMIIAY